MDEIALVQPLPFLLQQKWDTRALIASLHQPPYPFLPCTHNLMLLKDRSYLSFLLWFHVSISLHGFNKLALFLVSLTMTWPPFSYEIFSSSSFNRYSKIDLKRFLFGLSAESHLSHSKRLEVIVFHNNRVFNDLSPMVADCVLKQYNGCETHRWMLINTWV